MADGDALGISGILTAFEWGGRRVGSVGSWDGLTGDIAPIRAHPTFQAIRLVSDACMFDFTAEAFRIDETGRAEADKAPVRRPAIRGAGTKMIDIGGPPVGDWALLVHVGFLTSDGLPAWSDTLFRVESLFEPPGLTIGPDFFEVIAGAGCPSYDLATGARGSDACPAGYQLMDGREPVPVSSGAPLRFRLTDDWIIDEARAVAVDAGLVEGGFFAPEYSVFIPGEGRRHADHPSRARPRIVDPADQPQRQSAGGYLQLSLRRGYHRWRQSGCGDPETVQTNASPTLELLSVAFGDCLRETSVLTVGPDLGSADVAINAIDGAHGWIEASTGLGPISYWHGDATSAAVAFDGVRLAT